MILNTEQHAEALADAEQIVAEWETQVKRLHIEERELTSGPSLCEYELSRALLATTAKLEEATQEIADLRHDLESTYKSLCEEVNSDKDKEIDRLTAELRAMKGGKR